MEHLECGRTPSQRSPGQRRPWQGQLSTMHRNLRASERHFQSVTPWSVRTAALEKLPRHAGVDGPWSLYLSASRSPTYRLEMNWTQNREEDRWLEYSDCLTLFSAYESPPPSHLSLSLCLCFPARSLSPPALFSPSQLLQGDMVLTRSKKYAPCSDSVGGNERD